MSKVDILQILEKEITPIYRENYRQMKECFRQAGVVDDVFGEVALYIHPHDFICHGYNIAAEYYFHYHPYVRDVHLKSILTYRLYGELVEVLLPVEKITECPSYDENIPTIINSLKLYKYGNYVLTYYCPVLYFAIIDHMMKEEPNNKENHVMHLVKNIKIYQEDDFDCIQFILDNKVTDFDKMKEILKAFSRGQYKEDVLSAMNSL